MKKLKKQIKSIALSLSILILFQGCTVYKSTPVTLDQAVQNASKVKVMTKSSEIMKYKKIEVENGNYYGIKKAKKEMVKTPLDEKFIASIKEKDKTLSTILTIGIPVVILGAGIAILAASLNDVYY